MERDLALFLSHTDQHVIDQIKREHPEWATADGVCKPCAEYYKKQLSGEPAGANIGPHGRRKRFLMGIGMLVLACILAFLFRSSGAGRLQHLLLFIPIFFGIFGLIQAREKTCAVLAEFGVRDMDSGQCRIDSGDVARSLKARGRKIFLTSILWASVLTALFFLFS